MRCTRIGLLALLIMTGCGDDDRADVGDSSAADVGGDASADAEMDARVDAPDAPPDAERDAGPDAPADAASDVADATTDAATDTATDAGSDTGADTGTDASLPDSAPPPFCAPMPEFISDARSGLGRVYTGRGGIGEDTTVFEELRACDLEADPSAYFDLLVGNAVRWEAPRDGRYLITPGELDAEALLVHRELPGCLEPVACQQRTEQWVDARAGESFIISVAGPSSATIYSVTIDVEAHDGTEVCSTPEDEDGDGDVSCADDDCAAVCDRPYLPTGRASLGLSCRVYSSGSLGSDLNIVFEEPAAFVVSTDSDDPPHNPSCARGVVYSGRRRWTAPFTGFYRARIRTAGMVMSLHDLCSAGGAGGQLGCGSTIRFTATEGERLEFVFGSTEEDIEDVALALEIVSYVP